MPWDNPFSLSGHWYKGNLHTHTSQSDGLKSPEQAAAWYQVQGYDFVAITDHWILSPGDDSQASEGFVIVGGAEFNGSGYHMLGLGISALPDRALADSPERIAQEIAGQGGLAYVAHPYWTGQTSAQISQIAALNGIEVYNSVCEKMDGLGHGRVQWDELLAGGARLSGLAVDDVHWKHGAEGGGFVMVRAPELREAALLKALAQGRFYASTGPLIQDLRVVHTGGGPALKVRCSPCKQITYYASASRGRRFGAPEGAYLNSAIYPLQADQVYLRVECQDGAGGIAWSNPVYLDDIL